MLDDITTKQGVVRLTYSEIHSYDAMAAFSAMVKHATNVRALELGDQKTDVSAEWLSLLCAGVTNQ
jgi:hypothetical protein